MPFSSALDACVTQVSSRTCRDTRCDVRADTSDGCRSSIEADERGAVSSRPIGRHYRGPASSSRRTRWRAPGQWIFGFVRRRGVTGWSLPHRLSAQAEAFDDRPVAVDVGLRKVVEQPAPLADQEQEPPAAVMVVLVELEVLRQIADPTRQ